MEPGKFLKALSSYNDYQDTGNFLAAIQQNNKNIIDMCGQIITSILSEEKEPHLPKLLALKFINEVLETQQEDWIAITGKKFLPILEEVGQFSKESDDENRGKELFLINYTQRKQYDKIKELEQVGMSYFRYTLESIWVWSKWFPLDNSVGKLSLYKIAQERLALMKVKFPQVSYFRVDEILNHMQIQRPPKELLEESRLKIQEHLKDNTKTDLQHYQTLMDKTYYSETRHNLQSTKTYSKTWQWAVEEMRKGKLGADIEIKLKTCRIKLAENKLFTASSNMKQSRLALQQQTMNFTSVLNEKEKLLTEINNHILEKDALNKQLFQKSNEIQTLLQQIEMLKQQNMQLKLNNDTSFSQPNNYLQQQELESTKDLERLLQRKEIEIKRQNDQILHYQSVINSLNSNVDHLQTFKMATDDELFKLQQKSMEQGLLLQEYANKSQFYTSQISKLNETIKQSKESLQQHLRMHGDSVEKYTNYTLNLESENTKLIWENQEVKGDNEILRQKHEMLKKENEELRKNNEFIKASQTTKQPFFKSEKYLAGNSTIQNNNFEYKQLNRKNESQIKSSVITQQKEHQFEYE